MRLKFVIVLGAWCAMNASAQIAETTATTYVKKVEMPESTQNTLKQQAEAIINSTYSPVIAGWNSVDPNKKFSARTVKIQFQGSLGYKMALSLPAEAKSDVDVAFLYLYNSGNNQPQPPNPPSPPFTPVQLKEIARNVFQGAYPGPTYTYAIKDPVVVIQKGTGTAADHFDIAFFDELLVSGATPPSETCINTAVTTSPCSELNWGTSPNWGTSGNQQNWAASDRLNLNGTLNAVFDQPAHTVYSHEAGKIFKEWRYQMYGGADTDVVSAEKPPSIALVTLLYSYLKTGPTYSNNAFMLLRNTIQKAAVDNFRNGQCTNNPQTFAITALTYPNDNLLGKLTAAQKQEFCTKLMDFKGALEYATMSTTSNAQGIDRLKPYLPLFP